MREELDMICRHSPEGEASARALRTEVMERLRCTADDFLTSVVVSLEWDYDAHISNIHTDQWSGVEISFDDQERSVWVECDLVEDGIAAAWKHIADSCLRLTVDGFTSSNTLDTPRLSPPSP